MKKITIMTIVFLLAATTVFADSIAGSTVITLGEDLTQKQKEQMLNSFNASDAEIITVSNQEEHQYLDGLVSKQHIGSRAISSAMIQTTDPGTGIVVETHNITWVSKEMYENALATAGIKDAKVKVDAPFAVSGTAALTGIFKAYEAATGKTISEDSKKIANEEMVITATIGESIGDQQKAAELFTRIKAELSKHTGNLTEDDLRQIVINISSQMGLELTEQEIDSVVSILIKIQGLNMNWDQVIQQISSFKGQVEAFLNDNPEAKSLLEDFVTFVMGILQKVLAWLGASNA